MPVRIEDAHCTHSTDKAILVNIDGDECWIPHGQIDDDSEVWRAGDRGDLVITDWIAEQKGIA